jgi:hypothetical protein
MSDGRKQVRWAGARTKDSARTDLSVPVGFSLFSERILLRLEKKKKGGSDGMRVGDF